MVDGAPVPGTVLTLSHWPATPTPPGLRADLSAEIAFAWLGDPRGAEEAEVATIDHVDQDGLVGLYALVAPEDALARRSRLVAVARAGDFAVASDREAARASFALAALGDPARSPLPGVGRSAGPWATWTATLATEALARLPALVADPAPYRELWEEEDTALTESAAAITNGEVEVEEHPALDLAVVRVPEGRAPRLATRFCSRADAPCHPVAVHNATGALRVLTVQGRRYELVLRYESWVRYVSRAIAPRVALGPLAGALEAEEPGGARWVADPVAALVPRLRLREGDESGLDPARVIAVVQAHLATAPPAWSGEGAVVGG